MKLIALCGAAGAGKDTVADLLPSRKLAFADTLYREVAEAFGVSVDELRSRETKEVSHELLYLDTCVDDDFKDWQFDAHGWKSRKNSEPWALECHSPRRILQWWGDYRRAQDPDYFLKRLQSSLGGDCVITDCRFPNEAAMVRQLGGQIWQIKRPGYEAGGTGHASDTAGDEFAPDVVLVNAGGLEDLRATVLKEWDRVAS